MSSDNAGTYCMDNEGTGCVTNDTSPKGELE